MTSVKNTNSRNPSIYTGLDHNVQYKVICVFFYTRQKFPALQLKDKLDDTILIICFIMMYGNVCVLLQ